MRVSVQQIINEGFPNNFVVENFEHVSSASGYREGDETVFQHGVHVITGERRGDSAICTHDTTIDTPIWRCLSYGEGHRHRYNPTGDIDKAEFPSSNEGYTASVHWTYGQTGVPIPNESINQADIKAQPN